MPLCKMWKFRKTIGIYKVCAVLPVLMQHNNIADGKGMSFVVCRVVYIEFYIKRTQFFALCLSLNVRKLPV